MDLIKLPEHYCDFQKHANSAQVNGYYKIHFGFHLSGTLRKQKRGSKGHACQLWLVDFDPFGLFLVLKAVAIV